MRALLKRLAERALVAGGAGDIVRRAHTHDALVLAYHNVRADGDPPAGDASLHLPRAAFARQLDLLQKSHDVVPLAAILEAPSASTRRPRVAITFDDAYHGAMSAGVAELAARGLPATVFVAPGILGEVPWWDSLAGPTGEVDPDRRQHALWRLTGRRDAVLQWAGALARPAAGLPRLATEAELLNAAGYHGLSVAPHGWSHPNLCAIPLEDERRELHVPLAWLRKRFARVLPVLAYPYGLSSPGVQAATSAAGYVAAFTVHGGWLAEALAASPFALPRFNVPAGITLDGFALRVNGIGLAR